MGGKGSGGIANLVGNVGAHEFVDIQAETTELLRQLVGDPEAYAEVVFPWGEEGTLLEGRELKTWQRSYLRELGQELASRGFDGVNPAEPILDSTASGHGIGKSALTAIVTKCLHDTYAYSRGVVTANTATQLKIRTWAEVGKWHRMSLTSSRSEYFASRGNMALVNVAYPESWRVDAFTCTKENSEGFQGQHATTSVPFYIFDEASGIPQEIWTAASGGLTDGQPIWLTFGNGTRNSGAFYDSHHSQRRLWRHRSINAMDVEGANLKLFQRWIDTYGWDSDFVKVRVRGLFPAMSSLQFISTELVEWCRDTVHYEPVPEDPLVWGLDVAREGDDESVLCRRRGRLVMPITERWAKNDTSELIAYVAHEAATARPDAIFVDGDGVGGPVVDMLRKLKVPNIIEIHGAARATGRFCANMRAQMWHNLRDALQVGIDLPNDEDLVRDLTALEFGYRLVDNRILLESKRDAKRRGVSSPDIGDALALTYALPVAIRVPTSREDRKAFQGRDSTMVTDHYAAVLYAALWQLNTLRQRMGYR